MWKLQTDMKIANWYENCKCPRRNYTPKCENCKLTWKLQTHMKIANWYENCKAILMFRCIVPMWTFAIFIWDTAGMKLALEKNVLVRLRCGWKKFNETISCKTFNNSYFNTNSYADTVWFIFWAMIPLLSLRYEVTYFFIWFHVVIFVQYLTKTQSNHCVHCIT